MKLNRLLARPSIGAALIVAGLLNLQSGVPHARAASPPSDPPEGYTKLRDAALQHVGRLRGAEFRQDRVVFLFEDAELYMTDAGARSGAVVLGRGTVRIDPPHEVEAGQFEKYLDESMLDLEFRRIVLRFGGADDAERLAALAAPGGRPDLKEAEKQYRDRHRRWHEHHFINVDARVFVDMLDDRPGPRFFMADIDAKGWFTIGIDPRRMEEVRVYKSHSSDRAQDVWSSFHLQRDYATGGRTSTRIGSLDFREHWEPDFEAPDIAVDMLLDKSGDVEAVASVRLRALRPTRLTRLDISPVLEVRELTWSEDEGAWPPARVSVAPNRLPQLGGEPLTFVQDKKARSLREDEWDSQIIVPLPRRLEAGESIRLHVRYAGQLLVEPGIRIYALLDPTRWFPQHPHARRSRFHTTFRTPHNYQAASGGLVVRDETTDGTRVVSRVVDSPSIGMSFQYGRLDSETYGMPDGTEFTVYSSRDSTVFNPGRRDDTVRDLKAAFELFESYFGPAPFGHLALAEKPGNDAWAFHGFVLMPSDTFAGMHTGVAAFYRTHELAHQWWGSGVTWDDYHDQWLSEGFAQYAGALFTHIVRDDEKEFLQMLRAWRKDIQGKGDIGQRLNSRNYGYAPEFLRKSKGSKSGPIWLGYRLGSDKTPPDYRVLVYEKGAFVLHMLRMLRYDWETGDDSDFRRLMRTFQERYVGRHASTHDFFEVAEEVYDEDLLWFFDQWVYGTDLPEYRADLETREIAGQWRLTGSIRQDRVGHDFRMPVPVRVQFADGSSQVVVVTVAGSGTEVDEVVRGRADRIELNPLEAVLAEVR